MDIKIEEQDDLLCVCVKVESYDTKVKRKTIINTKELRHRLEKMGHKLGEAVQTDQIHNLNGKTQGTWFFKKKVEKPVDKPVEDVIIVVEKEVKPKPTRKKRTRSSIKKVSTED
jgi:hypothetical protein|tara:strand:+ start:1120 stop:1461 length:342 start_codon:yes stop_codon:yes gene_type:complete